jgi:hypothetical protein
MKRCEWCGIEHPWDSQVARRHRRYVRTRANGGVAPAHVRKHGANTYNNWGCRCDACMRGNADHSVLMRAQARQKAREQAAS